MVRVTLPSERSKVKDAEMPKSFFCDTSDFLQIFLNYSIVEYA